MPTTAMTRFWISWVQPTEDWRPLTDPPQNQIVGWWCSGYDPEDRATLCALVSASTLDDAKNALRVSWPEVPPNKGDWRFAEEREPKYLPGDRFPLEKSWEKERHEALP